jgi:hypothetical protein
MAGKITRQCFRSREMINDEDEDYDDTIEVVIWDKKKLITKRTRVFDLLSEDD